MKQLSPSILAADFGCLGQILKELEAAGIQKLHLDVMDGVFVPSISFGMPLIASLRPGSRLFFDVHMMVEDPDRYVEVLQKSGADGITVHFEACRHLDRCLNHIGDLGLRRGIALNPATPVQLLWDILPETDLVLIMSVNPGFGGQKWIPYTLEKIKTLHSLRRDRNLDFVIQVDGGVNRDNIREIAKAGADELVSGSAVFRGDMAANIKLLQSLIS